MTPLRAPRSWRRRLAGWVALAGVLAALIMPIPSSYPARWVGHVQDLCHIPAFAVFTLAVMYLTGRVGWSVGIAAIVGTAAEWLQPLVGRQASVTDWLLSLTGTALAGLWLDARSRSIRTTLVVSAVLLAIPVAWKSPHLLDGWSFHRSFPVLSDFRSPFEHSRWYLEQCELTQGREDGKPYGELTFAPVDEASAAILYCFHQDWSRYETVSCEFEVMGDEAARLLFSIRNAGDEETSQHFDRVNTYQPGPHRFEMRLAEAARGDRHPPVDVRCVQGFYIAVGGTATRTIRLRRIWLE